MSIRGKYKSFLKPYEPGEAQSLHIGTERKNCLRTKGPTIMHQTIFGRVLSSKNNARIKPRLVLGGFQAEVDCNGV